MEPFQAKAREFLKAHKDHVTLYKVRRNVALTATDLGTGAVLLEAGVGNQEEIARSKEQSDGFGLFIRSPVGVDRETANRKPSTTSLRARPRPQIEFINLIVDTSLSAV